MADAITIQELIDARTDAKTLEEAVNGDAVTTVLSRLGETYPTLSNALNQIDGKLDSADTQIKQGITSLFENGGLPATPFKTKALMTASALVDGKYAMVTDDSVAANNGLYVKTAGAWVKSGYDPVAISKGYTDSILSEGVISLAINPIYGFAIELLKPETIILDPKASNGRAYLKIRVDDASYLEVKNSTATYSWSWVFRDEGENFILKSPTGKLNGVFDIPEGAKWAYRNYMVTDASEFESPDLYISKKLTNNVNTLIDLAVDPIKDVAQKFNSSIQTSATSQDLLVLTDKNGVGYARFNADGELFINGLKGSVQERVENVAVTLGENKVTTTYRREKNNKSYPEMSDRFANLVSKSKLSYANTALVPNGYNNTKYNTSDEWIDDVRINDVEPSDFVPIRGYDSELRDDIGVVHPQVCTFKEKVAGYFSWMCITPYTNTVDDYEIPFIYGSNDPKLKTWELIPTFPAPFEKDPVDKDGSYRGHLSDPCFTYDPHNGDLLLVWRESLFYNTEAKTGIFDALRASRFDGVKWSDNYYLYAPENRSVSGLISPSILYNENDNLFYLYFVSLNNMSVMYCTSENLWGDWSKGKATNIEGVPNDCEAWHMEVKIVGNKVVALIHEDMSRTSGITKDDFFFAISDDFVNFKRGASGITQKPDSLLYKPSFEVEYLPNKEARFIIIYTTDNYTNPKWRLYVSESNIIKLGV